MKKKIMIFNVPAQELGALSILKNSFEQAINDKNEYIFVISGNYLKEQSNVKVVKFPWVKKSWFHRIFFDTFITKKLIQKENVSEVISYQNMIVKAPKNIPQTIYLHNAIPFSNIKFSIFKEPKLWIYQNILSKKIFASLKKADQIIVQTNWMKTKILNSVGEVSSNQIIIEDTSSLLQNLIGKKKYSEQKDSLNLFIYPAAPFAYKNHYDIIEAVKKISREKRNMLQIIFTFRGDENILASKIKSEINRENLPITLIGKLSHEKAQEYLLSHRLLFSSKLETLGLPLLEAQLFDTPIVCIDSELFREVTQDYNNVTFYKNKYELANILSEKN